MRIETTVTQRLAPLRGTCSRKAGPSERVEKVLYALLKGEEDAWRSGERDWRALTPANYEFTALPTVESGQHPIRLKPRRSDPKLIDGILTVSNGWSSNASRRASWRSLRLSG